MEEDFGEDVDEDWIIDDLGGAAGGIINDSSKEKEKSYAREIGGSFCGTSGAMLMMYCFSIRYKGPAAFPAWCDTLEG